MTFLANMDQFVKSEREYLSLLCPLVAKSSTFCVSEFLSVSACLTSYSFSGATRLRPEGQPMLSMKTSLMPRMLVTICQALTSATATWWSFTTTPTEYVSLKLCLLFVAAAKEGRDVFDIKPVWCLFISVR